MVILFIAGCLVLTAVVILAVIYVRAEIDEWLFQRKLRRRSQVYR